MRGRCAVLLALLCLCLTACGEAGQESIEVRENVAMQEASEAFSEAAEISSQGQVLPEGGITPESAETESGMSREERQEHDWRTEDWKLDEAGDWGQRLYASEYIYGLNSEAPAEAEGALDTYYCILGDSIYSLDEYYRGEEQDREYWYYLNCYDSSTGELWHRLLELPQPPELEEYGESMVMLNSFEVQSDRELVIFLTVRQRQEPYDLLAYLAVHTSMEGELLSTLDLYPAMIAGGAVDDISYISQWSLQAAPASVYLDGDGYYYLRLISWETESGRFISDVSILDPTGAPIGTMKPQGGHSPVFAMKTPEGEPVFKWLTGTGIKSSSLMYYDKDAQEGRELLKLREKLWGENYWTGAMTEDGYLYFMEEKNRLCRCDLYTGKREYCLGYGQLGLGDWPGMVKMAIGQDGKPLFLDTLENNTICRLGTEEPETAPIRLVSLTEDCSFIENMAQRFSKRHMENPIEVEKPEEGQEEEYRTRRMAELVSGSGADIYYVSAADMQILYEKEVLADLSGVLPPEVEEAVYPGVLDGGMRGSRRVGLAPEARAVTMMVSEKYRDGEGWRLEELLDMADAHPELTYPIICGGQYMDGYRLLRLLLFQDLDNTPFLDLRSGSCDFEHPLFIRLLELAKRYYDHPIEIGGERNMPRELMEEGNYAAVIMQCRDFPEFNQTMSMLAADCYQIGFPTEEGTGCYWQTDYYLVVNREAEYPELIYEYLAYLLGEEAQNQTARPVRRDMIGKHIVEEADEDNPMRYSDEKGGYYYLETGEDGTVWQEEYEQMQSRSVLVTKDTGAIQQIIMEEAENYFTGVRDAQAVAGLIQNRVQLYLKEQGAETEGKRGKGRRNP